MASVVPMVPALVGLLSAMVILTVLMPVMKPIVRANCPTSPAKDSAFLQITSVTTSLIALTVLMKAQVLVHQNAQLLLPKS